MSAIPQTTTPVEPARAAAPPGPAEPPPASANEPGTARILVVDDQPANLQLVGSMLGHLGHEIIPAADGATALKRVALRPPDLILLDVLMPGLDGCEVCRQLKANPAWADIPVVFLSAADDKELIVRALDSGGVDYITKPINHAELVSRVRTQLALKTTRDHLKQLAEDKDELLGILAHDLKSCLAGINMSADWLHGQIGRLNEPRLAQVSENMLRSSAQALAFVKEFLANVNTDHGFAVKPATINLAAAAAGVVQRHQEAARRKHLEIQADFPAAAVTALADATALDQVLDNLLSNALKFSPEGKKVFVTVRPTGQHAECIIRDEGPGFTPDDKQRMFRRYERLSAKPTAGEPSTGLGLSIVRKLVQALHGDLRCESAPGSGATFIVRLPRPVSNGHN